MDLNTFFRENPKAAIGFSGGVDSSYLLYAAKKSGCDILPIYVKSPFQPQFELDDALRMAQELSLELIVLYLDGLDDKRIRENPADRCYYCKSVIFGAIKREALERGYTVLLDGTNASDDFEDRPGMRAIGELTVLSPLRLCGITKDRIRTLSCEAGLFTWDKPAYACLATRVPFGTPISHNLLEKIEFAEGELFDMGFYDFRARIIRTGDDFAVRLQIKESQFKLFACSIENIRRRLAPAFKECLLDLTFR